MIYRVSGEAYEYVIEFEGIEKCRRKSDIMVSIPKKVRALFINDFIKEDIDKFKKLKIDRLCLEGHVDLDIVGELEETIVDITGKDIETYIYKNVTNIIYKNDTNIVKPSYPKIHSLNGKYIIGREDQAEQYFKRKCSSNSIPKRIKKLTILLNNHEAIDQFLDIKIPELTIGIPHRLITDYIIRYDEKDDLLSYTYIGATISRKTKLDKELYGDKIFLKRD